jgi:sporulation protein YlmC with PRC-barrel domain
MPRDSNHMKSVASLFPTSPLERVREGMTVVDAQNRPLGTVANVFPGYPDAVTTNEDELQSGLVGLIIAPLESTGGTTSIGAAMPIVVERLLNDADVPDQLRLELLRAGFIEVKAPGLRGPARFIHGDEVQEVADTTVRLKPSYRPPIAAGESQPRVLLGATVRSADGQEVGKVDRLIVSPYTLAIRAMVIRKGSFLPRAVEIPLIAVQDISGNEVRVRYTAEQVEHLPEFVDAHYAAPPTGYVPPAAYTRDSLLWPLGVPLLPPPPPRRNETAVRWDMNNAEITTGSDVLSRDGVKVGEVLGVSLDTATRRPRSLLVRRGFLFQEEIEFPFDLVREVGDGVVYLDVDAQRAREYTQARRPRWSAQSASA